MNKSTYRLYRRFTAFRRLQAVRVAVRTAGAFVIYDLNGTLGYVAGREAPDGAYLVERWVRGKRGWTLYE